MVSAKNPAKSGAQYRIDTKVEHASDQKTGQATTPVSLDKSDDNFSEKREDDDSSKGNNDKLACDASANCKSPENEMGTTQQYPGGWKLALAFAALILVLLVGGIDSTILATGVPTITDEFNSTDDIGWYLTAYRLAACAMQFPFGKLYKHFPTKYVFMTSNFTFMVGSVVCAAAQNSPMFIFGRTLAGVGIAGGSAGFFNLIMEVVAPRLRPMLGGIFGAIEMLSGILGPIIGGLVVQHTTWRWCFWINVPICVAALISMLLFLPYIPKQQEDDQPLTLIALLQEMDAIGMVLMTGGLVALFLAINWGGVSYAWDSHTIIALFVLFGFLQGVFAFHAARTGEKGILPPRLIKNRNVYSGLIFALGCVSSLSIVEYYVPTYYQIVHDFSPQKSGLLMLPSLIATLAGFLIQGAGASYFGYYTPFSLAGSILMPVSAGLVTTWGPRTSLAKLIVFLAMVGFSTGIGFQGPLNAVQTTLKKEDVPLGIAVVLFSQMFGPAIFVSLGQTIFANSLARDLRRLFPGRNTSGVSHMGLNEIKSSFSGEDLQKLVSVFNEAIKGAWYLALGLTCLTLLGSLMMPWAKITKNEKPKYEESAAKGD
ncbi:hypothetical protein CKM354_000895300 [Cercospora kikuchii]|uniref:Major facilitator superfamily (MFS) profile domain-containing protein n=1 Tax=Cercospora kikuchii TaxID=84275 RepID=A0A9P3CQP5_9PEZI|nr:uncharacterized protein CKM354_000895300 [Cercospora kikuchii]GIZ45802.1 hypothetical protein CKM354_000895300 [Cercospora kikuchii]